MQHIFSPENKDLVSSRLRSRIVIFLVIGIVLLGLTAYDVFQGQVTAWIGLLALVAGLLVGFVFGRLMRVRWHETEEKVVTQLDLLYFVLIAAYIALSIARRYVLGDFLSGAALLAVTYAVASGILLGRFFGLHHNIMRVLETKKP